MPPKRTPVLPTRLTRHVRLLAAAVAVVGSVTATATSRAQSASAPTMLPLPDSLSNFAALVRRLSDAGGYFDTDNLISNERGYQQVLGAMQRLGVRGGAYIGVGPDQNFTYIARVRPRIAFLVDIRRDNMLQHLLFKALFARSRNRAEFLALLTGRVVPPDIAAYGPREIGAIVRWIDTTPPQSVGLQRAKDAVRDEVQRTGLTLSTADFATIARFHEAFAQDGLSLRFTSTGRPPQWYYPTLRQLILEHDASGVMRGFLASEDDFQFVKQMQRRNLIIPVTGDLAGPNTLSRIGQYLVDNSTRVSALYVSNVEDYLIRDGRIATYVASVRALPRDTNAVIIRSFFGGGMGHPESTQEYYATQLLQRMDGFVNDSGVASVQRYRDLVMRNYVPLRK